MTIEEAISKARSMLDLPDNWDDEGSVKIELATFERAAALLRMGTVDAPHINPYCDGSIDLHWRKVGRELLVNVPASGPISYYGSMTHGAAVKGEEDFPAWLLDWVMQNEISA